MRRSAARSPGCWVSAGPRGPRPGPSSPNTSCGGGRAAPPARSGSWTTAGPGRSAAARKSAARRERSSAGSNGSRFGARGRRPLGRVPSWVAWPVPRRPFRRRFTASCRAVPPHLHAPGRPRGWPRINAARTRYSGPRPGPTGSGLCGGPTPTRPAGTLTVRDRLLGSTGRGDADRDRSRPARAGHAVRSPRGRAGGWLRDGRGPGPARCGARPKRTPVVCAGAHPAVAGAFCRQGGLAGGSRRPARGAPGHGGKRRRFRASSSLTGLGRPVGDPPAMCANRLTGPTGPGRDPRPRPALAPSTVGRPRRGGRGCPLSINVN